VPRNITPSDVDVVFDDKEHGRTLLVEFKYGSCVFRDLDIGQKLVYQTSLCEDREACTRLFVSTAFGMTVGPIDQSTQSSTCCSFSQLDLPPCLDGVQGRYFAEINGAFVFDFYEGKSMSNWLRESRLHGR